MGSLQAMSPPAEDSASFPAEGQCVAYHLSEMSLNRVLLALSCTDLRDACFQRDWSFLLA